ncbi:MAG: lipid-A-disaccharide synthase [Calditrichaeota bacterium]|nr:MAG: lipid-A-disaccharide synthase [Calditrichota bacterium]
MKKEKRNPILFIAGEVSGDLHGSRVLQALKKNYAEPEIFGIGGQLMAAEGMEQLYNTKQMAILGFTEVIRHLPFLHRVFRRLEKEIQLRKPACAVLIDYPGFNLRLAKILKKYDIPILWYIAPQVWAWHKSRIKQMAHLIDHLAVVFPFEVSLFQDAGLPTTFVGHPLLEGLRPEFSKADFLQKLKFEPENKILGLLPGSRKQEVERLLPDMLETSQLVANRLPGTQFVIAQSPNLPDSFYREQIDKFDALPINLIQHATYSIMKFSTACVVASGTATLETGCFATPMAIVYRVSPLTYAIGKRLIQLKNIGLVNIVAGEEVVPEFVQREFKPQIVANYIKNLLSDAQSRQEISEILSTVRAKLGDVGASGKVANLIAELAWRQ